MKIILAYILLIFNIAAFSQQQTNPPAPPQEQAKSNSEPVDLPEIIIADEARLFTSSGVKQIPSGPELLTQHDLDTLNTLEKQLPALLPSESLPHKPQAKQLYSGYIKGCFGRFTTPAIEGAYGFDVGNYKLFGKGGYESGSGHLDNADYSKYDLMLISDYIAPDKFFIFGGSHTRTSGWYRHQDYKLYSQKDPIERSTGDIGINVKVDGSYEGYDFSTGAGFESVGWKDDISDLADNQINGFLSLKSNWKKFSVNSSILLEFHTLRGDGNNFLQGTVGGSYTDREIRFTAQAGIQSSRTSKNVVRGGLMLNGSLQYQMNEDITLDGIVSTGLEKNTFADFLRINPYLCDSTMIDYTYNIASLQPIIYYHPTVDLNLTAKLNIRFLERYPVFSNSDSGSFLVNYISADMLEAEFEGFWNLTKSDRLHFNIAYKIAGNADNNNKVPYIAPINLSASYGRQWNASFGTQFGIDYIGRRYSDLNNENELDSYSNIWIDAKYDLNRKINFFLKLENIANSDIYIWEGYKERSLYFEIGAQLKL